YLSAYPGSPRQQRRHALNDRAHAPVLFLCHVREGRPASGKGAEKHHPHLFPLSTGAALQDGKLLCAVKREGGEADCRNGQTPESPREESLTGGAFSACLQRKKTFPPPPSRPSLTGKCTGTGCAGCRRTTTRKPSSMRTSTTSSHRPKIRRPSLTGGAPASTTLTAPFLSSSPSLITGAARKAGTASISPCRTTSTTASGRSMWKCWTTRSPKATTALSAQSS